jgi:hypothetical protein
VDARAPFQENRSTRELTIAFLVAWEHVLQPSIAESRGSPKVKAVTSRSIGPIRWAGLTAGETAPLRGTR